MNFKFFALLAMPVLLSACVTAEQMAKMEAEQKIAFAKQDHETCVSYGAVPKTSSYVECRMHLDSKRMQLFIANAQAARAANDAMMAQGLSMMQNSRAQSNSLSCNTTKLGNSLQTNCF